MPSSTCSPDALFAASEERLENSLGPFPGAALPGETHLPTELVTIERTVVDAHLHRFDASSRSPYSRLSQVACIPAASLRGERPVQRWVAESLAVLLKVDPSVLIVTQPPAEASREKGGVDVTPRESKPWSKRDVEILRDHAWRGLKEVAHILGRGESSVQKFASKMRISLKKHATRPADTSATATSSENEQPCVEHYCSDITECKGDLAHTPCGADPCELVADDLEARRCTIAAKLKLMPDPGPWSDPRDAMYRELIDTHLQLVASELNAGVTHGIGASQVCSMQERIDRVRELVKEVLG